MMKKSLCVLFVLALIAQICARPEDKDTDKDKADGEKVAKEAQEKATKIGKDKEDAVADKAEAKVHTASEKEKSAEAETTKKTSEDGPKEGHGGHPISKVINGMEKVGEKIAKRGTEMITDFMGKWGL